MSKQDKNVNALFVNVAIFFFFFFFDVNLRFVVELYNFVNSCI